MDKKTLKFYVLVSIIQVILVVLWFIVFNAKFPNPVFSTIATILASHLFFWFGGYSPRIGFRIAKEKGRLKEQMESIKVIIFLWFIVFGLGSIFAFFSPIIKSEYENVIFFLIPSSMSIGAYLCWRYIKTSLSNIE